VVRGAWVLLFALAASMGAIVAAAALLLVPPVRRERWIPALVGVASGSLVGAALLGLIPDSAEVIGVRSTMTWVLVGIIGFLLGERLLMLHPDHSAGIETRGPRVPRATARLLLVGDALHNFGDGVVIALSFGSSVALGVSTSLAIVTHEVAQEVGDFAVLLDSGYGTRSAFWWNSLSGSTTLVGAALGCTVIGASGTLTPYIMALAAASFLYIGLADLVPLLHRRREGGFRGILAVLAGVGIVVAMRALG
jgi:zinc and cadmium transporter